jgi:CRP/FNR family cyclic AMP-dependent transcriptional regulator
VAGEGRGYSGAPLPIRPSQKHNHSGLAWGWTKSPLKPNPHNLVNLLPATASQPAAHPQPNPHPEEVDPFYLFACQVEWEKRSEPTAGWELISAAQSPHQDTRAHARALLATSEWIGGGISGASSRGCGFGRINGSFVEGSMRTPYGLSIIDTCTECAARSAGFFCGLSPSVLKAFDQVSQHSILPAGAILFVEGQAPRGMFVLCSGRVKLSTTSREGKVLVLKTSEAGDALGLSAVISGENYEVTAETATPCQLDFVDRKNLLSLLENHPSIGMQAVQSLSREFQATYRDIHDLVLSRSSAGKLARLLLACTPDQSLALEESRLRSAMTHEEMAQRIGSSRETVTRLLSDLKKRQLIRLDGATLVIRDRTALEALAV